MAPASTTRTAHCWAHGPGDRIREFALLLIFVVLGVLAAGAAGAVPPVSFALHRDFPTGSGPYYPTIGDINGDHKADIVVANYLSNTVSVLLGDGLGGFVAAPDIPTGTNPFGTALADLNGDGKLDLAVATHLGGTTSVRLGDGAGNFGPAVEYPSSVPYSVAFADLNNDGKQDLVVVNNGCSVGSPSVSVRLGIGDGSFGPKNEFPVVGSCTELGSIADLDNDGKLDVVVCAWDVGLTVLFGDGAGGFAASTYVPGEWGQGGGATADFNGDGNLDLVAGFGYLSQTCVWLGNGDRTFGPRHAYPTTVASRPMGADVNVDGMMDVVQSQIDVAAVNLGNGDGTFGASISFLVDGGSAGSSTTGDINGDGRPDIVTGNCDVGTISVLLNTSGTTIAAQPPATCIAPMHPCVEVPVTISNRPDATPLRGYSVTVQLSSNLALCAPEIVQGAYLNGIAGTHYEVQDNLDGSYTVDCAILGGTCGATAASGTLFTLNLGSSAPSGTGTVSVTSVTLRDCDNAAVAGYAGAPATITIDNTVPGAVVLAGRRRRAATTATARRRSTCRGAGR